MADDDNERANTPTPELPEPVERALAEARGSKASGRVPRASGTNGARWLAAVPLTMAVLMFLLMMPRAAPPEDVPLPDVDGRALEVVEHDDSVRAAAARSDRLRGEVLAVGSALRALNVAQVKSAATGSAEELPLARAALDEAVRGLHVMEKDQAFDGLKTLRAVQLEGFLAEVERYEATGQVTTELESLGGSFIDRMSAAGWVEGRHVILDDAQRRVAFKMVWTSLIGADRGTPLTLSLDEQRALYTLYIKHPHPPEWQRPSFEAMRLAAKTETECKNANGKELMATEQWRLEKLKKLGEIDPAYPTSYALGVAYYRIGRFDQSMDAFRSWISKHPDGPYALRARNHLKAALAAYGPS